MYDGREYRFWCRCDEAPAWCFEGLDDGWTRWGLMTSFADQIQWYTLLQRVPVEEIRKLFPHCEWYGQGQHPKDSQFFSFWMSSLKEQTVYFIDWSGYEYVFTKHGREPQ